MLFQSELLQPNHGRLLPTLNSIPPQPKRRANPLFRGAIEQRAELSFGTFLGVYPADEAGLQKRKVHSRQGR
jgi:hypothetical protein